MLIRTVATLFILGLPAIAAASPSNYSSSSRRYDDANYGRLSYTQAEARVVARDPDGAGDADGVAIGGSALVAPQVFVEGSLTSVGSGNYDDDTIELGVGLRHAFTANMDLVGIAAILHDERSVGSRDLGSDWGPSLTGGMRFAFNTPLEFGAYATYTRLYEDGDLGLRGEGLYHFTPNFSAIAGLGLTDNERNATLGVRWYFVPGR